MYGALGDDITSLLGHQVQQFVYDETGREGVDSSLRSVNGFAAYWTTKCPDICEEINDTCEWSRGILDSEMSRYL